MLKFNVSVTEYQCSYNEFDYKLIDDFNGVRIYRKPTDMPWSCVPVIEYVDLNGLFSRCLLAKPKYFKNKSEAIHKLELYLIEVDNEEI